MCGITGIYNFRDRKPVDRKCLKSMTNSMVHRGPDDEGYYYKDDCGIGFGHRRLSIIDISGGKQPMCSFDKSIWIVFNGEIYNYLELKKNLIKDGYRFETNSDTEVIINIYKKYGIRGFNKLNGMFAFAIFDEINKSLILARDRFGIKPIYYILNNNSLIFGSEIKSLYLSKMIKKSIDKSALNLFISFRYNPAPYTLM
jgi:asparagine synthase (glutamine-hydrolysing)